jgi:hypothetical protein
VLCLAVISLSVRYAVARETVRHLDLHHVYQQINAQYFDGALNDLQVEWDDLNAETGSGAMAITDFDDDTAVEIRLDRRRNHSETAIRKNLQHEACHVYTAAEEPGHGPQWQACMKRFN